GMTPHFVTFTLTFTNGNSNGNDHMTVIDNIRLDATTFVPEPSTVAGGLLGVLGLCWFQRRRIRLILPRLRRT
ncbi:MAG TPA: PEP-CTERM sorting domain-containing protein, partial [Terriglobales bacterium]|nr:PEP-CTERM sorting domain-containing protein [Terriglobales bacterium]